MSKSRRSHVILVSTWDKRRAEAARNQAATVFHDVEGGIDPSPIQASAPDEYTFSVPFTPSVTGYEAQNTFIRWLEEQQNGSGSRSYAWSTSIINSQ